MTPVTQVVRNIAHINKIANAIEDRANLFDGQIGFYMGDFIHEIDDTEKAEGVTLDKALPECGTTACIAGWSRIIRTNDTSPIATGSFDWEAEAEAMGLTSNEGFGLFYQTGIPDKVAVKALRLIADGKDVVSAVDIATRGA